MGRLSLAFENLDLFYLAFDRIWAGRFGEIGLDFFMILAPLKFAFWGGFSPKKDGSWGFFNRNLRFLGEVFAFCVLECGAVFLFEDLGCNSAWGP